MKTVSGEQLLPLLRRYMPAAIIVLSVGFSFATYLTVAGALPLVGNYQNVFGLLLINLGLLFLLGWLVTGRILRIWRRRKSGGGMLHARMVRVFAFLTVAPAVVVGASALTFFNLIVNVWFSQVVNRALDSSGIVAEAYLDEHQKRIRTDAERLRLALDGESELIYIQPTLLEQLLGIHGNLLGLNEAMVFEKNGRVLATVGGRLPISQKPRPPQQAFVDADAGGIFIFSTSGLGALGGDRVMALVKLDRPLKDSYLYIGRPVDPLVVSYIETARLSRDQYQRLRDSRRQLQAVFAAIFVVTALLLLLAAIWLGLITADSIAKPIEALTTAAAAMSMRRARVQLAPFARDDELQTLGKAFNAMSGRIGSQRRTLEERNRFMQSVLKGVSAGVIGLNPKGEIRAYNLSASKLCGVEMDKFVAKPLSSASRQLGRLWQEFTASGIEQSERELQMENADGSAAQRTLFVRFTATRRRDETIGYVVTFDDLTNLIAANRRAAWSDVARRIAHEIKNPLTPIKLCAEWLITNRKGSPQTARRHLDTIVRQVDNIRRMTDEFAAFARLPIPKPEAVSPISLCKDAVFLQSQVARGIKFTTKFNNLRTADRRERKFLLDPILINQLLINLLKNAGEAIRADEKLKVGKIVLEVSYKSFLEIKVTDNGIGLEGKNINRLSDPYVTTRSGGTGLGLAVVNKIAVDHGGTFTIGKGAVKGAVALVILPALLPIKSPISPIPPMSELAMGDIAKGGRGAKLKRQQRQQRQTQSEGE